MHRLGMILWMVIGVFAGSLIVQGAEIKVPGDKSDNGVEYLEVLKFAGQFNGRVGSGIKAPKEPDNTVFVMVFKLPDLPANAIITKADLQFNLEIVSNPDKGFRHKADLYGVRTEGDNKVVGSDYFFGDTGSDTQATLIQGSIMTKETPVGLVHTDASGCQKLTEWLTTIYKGGGAGQYVFLRLNPDVQSEGSRFYAVSTADNPQEELRPVLTITTK